MTKGEQLIEEAKRRYKSGDRIEGLPWPLTGAKWGETGKNDVNYNCGFRGVYYGVSRRTFWYDEEADTLTNWGNGLGLLYHKGRWAGEPKPVEINYQIY